jgi:hypothetical protein
VSTVVSTAPGGVPTRSQIENWDSAHLGAASARWRAAADESDELFVRHGQNIAAPGGGEWTGDAKDAAWERASADRRVVAWHGDLQRAAAAIAENGRTDIEAAQRKALEAIADAEADGFRVGEDLSVTETRRAEISTMASRHIAAAEHAEDIRWHAQQLVQTDNRIGDQLNDKAEELTGVRFEGDGDVGGNPVQLVDNKFKQSPPPADDSGTGGDPASEIRRVLDKLPQGNKPWIREVRSPQDLENLWNWMRQNGTEVPNAYGDPSKGTAVILPDGTRVGQRSAAGSTGQPALDVKIPGERGELKVHINPRGGIPEIPVAPRPAVVEPPPPGPRPPAEPPPARGGAMPGGTGGGVIPDGTLPHIVELPKAGDPDLPVIGDGIPDRPND